MLLLEGDCEEVVGIGLVLYVFVGILVGNGCWDEGFWEIFK